MFTLDAAGALSLLNSIVDDLGPDRTMHVGDNCVYVANPYALILEPVCIVGHALHRLGVLRAVTEGGSGVDGQASACTPGWEFWGRIEAAGVSVTEDAQHLFLDAQAAQDRGEAWGTAVAEAVTRQRNRVLSDHPFWGPEAKTAFSRA